MANVKTTNQPPVAKSVKTKSSISLPSQVFKAKINNQSLFDAIMSERASVRQGTHKVKTRSEVQGSGRKPFSQKGTGNARQGSKRSPQWVGGGVAWGPHQNKVYKLKVNKKIKKLAFQSALTLKSKDKAILVHDFVVSKIPNTKKMLVQLDALKIKNKFKKILIITNDNVIFKSVANLQKVNAMKLSNLKVETIVDADFIIFSKDAIKKLKVGK